MARRVTGGGVVLGPVSERTRDKSAGLTLPVARKMLPQRGSRPTVIRAEMVRTLTL